MIKIRGGLLLLVQQEPDTKICIYIHIYIYVRPMLAISPFRRNCQGSLLKRIDFRLLRNQHDNLRKSKAFVSGPQIRHFISVGANMADTFTILHETTSIPWIYLIPLTTFTLRSIFTLPLSIIQRKRVVKQQEMRRVVQSVTPILKYRLAGVANEMVSKGNGNELKPEQIQLLAMKETRKRQKRLFKKNHIQMWKNTILPVVQIPLWVSISLGIRNLTQLEIERSTKEWFQSFTWNDIDLVSPLADYPMLAPMALGVFSLLNVEYNARMISRRSTDQIGIEVYKDENSRLSQSFKSIINVSRIGCIFMMGVASQSPLLLSIYWISSQFYSLIQNIILDKLWPYQR